MPAAKKREPKVLVHDASKLEGRLKAIGGSMSDDWNNIIANQAIKALWILAMQVTRRSSSSAMPRSMR